MGMDIKKLEEQIRDLPIEGQGAKRDLLPLYANSEAVDALIKYLADGVGLVVIRRNQQFWIDPEEQVTASYINHRDKVTVLVTERKLLPAGSRVLLADDWMSTAATMQACATVIEEAGCKVAGFAAVGTDDRSGVRNIIDSGSVRFVYSEK